MSESRAPTRFLSEALWRRVGEPSLEHCRLSALSDAYTLQGCVLALENGRPFQVQYVVECDIDWSTRTVLIDTIRGAEHDRLQLRRDPSGAWWRGEEAMQDFAGLIDIDLSISPSTNTLPIRRMSLNIGEAAATDAVWVRFPAMTIERLPQRYTRNAERHYTYESRGASFVAELEVDAEGLVVRYGRLWESVGT
jgi:uncharacterized protein